MMMVTVGLAVVTYFSEMGRKVGVKGISFERGEFNFGTALMLGIAYSCSIGGVGTPIGTPPNGILKAEIAKFGGPEITFIEWMEFAQPFDWVMILIAWIWLTYVANPVRLKEVPGGGLKSSRTS